MGARAGADSQAEGQTERLALPPVSVSFLGAREHVARLEDRLGAHRFCPHKGLVRNLEDMLGAPLPARSDDGGGGTGAGTGMGAEADDAMGMCGICYSLQINGESKVPQVSCENSKCGYMFHTECLLEWLQSDQSSRQTFNTIFGSCPYCSDPIICKTCAF